METVHDLQGGATPVAANEPDAIKFPVDFPLPKYPNSKATAATDTNVEKARIRSVMMLSTVDADTICGYYTAWFKKTAGLSKVRRCRKKSALSLPLKSPAIQPM